MGSITAEEIFQELEELVPVGAEAIEKQQQQNQNIYCPTIQHPKLSIKINDAAFEIITDALTSPSKINDEDDTVIKRSYRVMTYICEDLEEAQEMLKPNFGKDDDDLYLKYILNPTRAGLLAKKIFASYRRLCQVYNENLFEQPRPHIPHLNKTLSHILNAFPTQVVGASCVGGEKGLAMSLKPMLELHKHVQAQHSPLTTMAQIISLGCTGRKKDNSTLQQQQQQAMMGQASTADKILINHGHRRKFVHGLTQWGGFQHLVNLISEDIKCADEVSGILLSTIEFVSFPQQCISPLNATNVKNAKDDESVGEEALLSKLASEGIIHKLFACLGDKNARAEDVDAVSSTLLGLFELATGKARKQMAVSAVKLGDDDGSVEAKLAEEAKVPSPGIDDNKMIKAKVTDKMHSTINEKMESLLAAMDIYMHARQQGKEVEGGTDPASTAVKHPGRYTVEKPFTSKRLLLLTLFTDLISYESHCDSKDPGNYNCAVKALDTAMEFPIPPPTEDEIEEGATYNPWPGICDLLFDYPENNMFQVQFYRLIHAMCATNHEKTQKLVVQKCKFLSRAIKVCSAKAAPSSTRGVLLRCLNALRLYSQSLSSHSFLRHYLESHDGWKAFQGDLRTMTAEQQVPGGGIAVPINALEEAPVPPLADIDIDLGSAFAVELGFPPSLKAYIETANVSNVSLQDQSSKGKKKKSKKKKGKR